MGLKDNQQLILDLLASGVKIKEIVVGKLTGQSFALTGTMENKARSIRENDS